MMRTSLFRSACVLWFAAAWATSVVAQESGPGVLSADRAPKANAGEETMASAPSWLANTFSWAVAKVDAQSAPRDGFYPELGGMIGGAGIAVGPGFRHHLFGDRAIVDVSAALSWRRYSMMKSQITWPGLMHDRLSVGARVSYQDFKQINFFGIGTDSLKDQRTDYRLKDVDAIGFASVRANTWLSISGRAGVLRRLAIDRGTSTLYPSIEIQFDDTTAPSLTRQPGYLHGDLALDADTRDVPGYPSRGGRYRLSIAAFHDQTFASYSFRRIEADAAQYIAIGRTVLAVRARMDVSQTANGQDIPFYLLPSLGGSSSLRGYSDYRFRDRDLLMLNAEYQWPLFRAADAAVFYDTGSVAPAVGGLTRHFHGDYGVGVRLHSARHMMVRLDLARSHEGTRAVFTFTAPLALPKSTVVPYVP